MTTVFPQLAMDFAGLRRRDVERLELPPLPRH